MLAEANPFVFFGQAHLAAIAVTVAVPVVLIAAARGAGSAAVTRWIARSLAGVLIASEIVYYCHGLATMELGDFLKDHLPLHICGVGLYLTAWVLVRPNQFAYELAYFWGLAGTLQAVITPNLVDGFPSYAFVQFFITHGGIVAGVLFATLAMNMRPKRRAVLRAFLLTNVLMLVLIPINLLLDANYMFICGAPKGEAIFFFLDWPWYILFMEPVCLGLITILYLPFWRSNRRQGGVAGSR